MIRFVLMSTLTLALALEASAGLLPLEAGNFWVLRDGQTGETLTVRVGQRVNLQSGETYHYLTGYAGEYAIARENEVGNLVAFQEEGGAERILAGFTEPANQWWTAHGRACPVEGQTLEKRLPYDGPGVRISRALEIRYRPSGCADTGVIAEQFAENIGLVRRVVNTIAGPRNFDLVYARVGSQTIETPHHGRFSVLIDTPAGENAYRVTLRVDTGHTPALRLRFPTAQEFDVALRDPAGTVLWRWSDGRLFDPVPRENLLSDSWSATVLVPKPAEYANGFSVEGWLTGAPGEPKFAATASLPPPRSVPTSDRISSIVLLPPSVRGGEGTVARVTLEGPAPEPAVTLFLGTSSPFVAQVPVLAYVPAGQTTVEFPVTTVAVGQPQEVTISAFSGGKQANAVLRVTEPDKGRTNR